MAKILKLQRSVKYFSGHFVSLPLERRKEFKTTFELDLRLRCHKLALEKMLTLRGANF